jgi:hypothetical protein
MRCVGVDSVADRSIDTCRRNRIRSASLDFHQRVVSADCRYC